MSRSDVGHAEQLGDSNAIKRFPDTAKKWIFRKGFRASRNAPGSQAPSHGTVDIARCERTSAVTSMHRKTG